MKQSNFELSPDHRDSSREAGFKVPYLIKATTKTNIYGHRSSYRETPASTSSILRATATNSGACCCLRRYVSSFRIPVVVAKKPEYGSLLAIWKRSMPRPISRCNIR